MRRLIRLIQVSRTLTLLLLIFCLEACQNDIWKGRAYTVDTYISYLERQQIQFRLPNGLSVILLKSDSLSKIHARLEVRAGFWQEDSRSDQTADFLTHCLQSRTAKSLRDDRLTAFYRKKSQRFLQRLSSPSKSERVAALGKLHFWSTQQRQKLKVASYSDVYAQLGFFYQSLVLPNSTRFSYKITNIDDLSSWLIWERKRLSGVYYSDGFYPAFQSYIAQTQTNKPAPNVSLLWDQAKIFFDKYYHPSNMSLLLQGPMDLQATKKLIQKEWSSWQGKEIENIDKNHKIFDTARFRPVAFSSGVQGAYFRLKRELNNQLALEVLASTLKREGHINQAEIFFTEREVLLGVLYDAPQTESFQQWLEKKSNLTFFQQAVAMFQLDFFQRVAHPSGFMETLQDRKQLPDSWQTYFKQVASLSPMTLQKTWNKLSKRAISFSSPSSELFRTWPPQRKDSILQVAFAKTITQKKMLAKKIPLEITHTPGMTFQLVLEVELGYIGNPELLVALPFWQTKSKTMLEKLGVKMHTDIQPHKTSLAFLGLSKDFETFIEYFETNFSKPFYRSDEFSNYLDIQRSQYRLKSIEEMARDIREDDLKKSHRSYTLSLDVEQLRDFCDVAMQQFFQHYHKIRLQTPEVQRAWVAIYQHHKVPPRPLYGLIKKAPSLINPSYLWVLDEREGKAQYQMFLTISLEKKTKQGQIALQRMLKSYLEIELKQKLGAVNFSFHSKDTSAVEAFTLTFPSDAQRIYKQLLQVKKIFALEAMNPTSFFIARRQSVTADMRFVSYAAFTQYIEKARQYVRTSWLLFAPHDANLKSWMEQELGYDFTVETYLTAMKKSIR